MGGIDRRDVEELLSSWENGLDESDVIPKAEMLLTKALFEDFPEEDPRSIPQQVAMALDNLAIQKVTRADIPFFRSLLQTPVGQEAEAWRRWDEYWKGIDQEARRQSLKGHKYYHVYYPDPYRPPE